MANEINAVAEILVVDDEKNYRLILTRLLSNAGYRVLTADGPVAAMTLLKDHPVRLILSDLRMPLMDGLEFCRRVKQDIGEIPFILFSAFIAAQGQQQMNASGAWGFLDKPFDNDDVLAMVAAALDAPVTQDKLASRDDIDVRPQSENFNSHFKEKKS
jgi:two-component system NtrC family response regulator